MTEATAKIHFDLLCSCDRLTAARNLDCMSRWNCHSLLFRRLPEMFWSEHIDLETISDECVTQPEGARFC